MCAVRLLPCGRLNDYQRGNRVRIISTRKAARREQRWLARHPRFHVYFTPTGSSWLNMVKRFFQDLTQNGLRRGVFRDAEELTTTIGTSIDKHNDKPKPFIWTAKADILEKVKRAHAFG